MYLYEMHQHTARCSGCASADSVDVVRALKKAGFSGVVMTNHFFHGYTAVSHELPWEDFVRPYEEDYLIAKAEGDKIGIDVLFGIEEGVGGGKEVLLYGITPKLLYSHPELASMSLVDNKYLSHLSHIVREAGGLVYQAHPYRVRDYIKDPQEALPVGLLDGIEAYNACNSEQENALAVQYAKQHNLPITAGSDSHVADFTSGRFGIACPYRLHTEADLAKALRAGDYEVYLGEKQ